MSIITPLRLLAFDALWRLPHLSFSNPPLPLWLHKGIFFLCAGLFFCSMPVNSADALTLGINTAEGGVYKSRYVRSLTQWLADRECPLTIQVAQTGVSGDLVFDVRSRNPSDVLLLAVTGLGADDLNSQWLVRKVAGPGGVASIEGERVALLSPASYIGHQVPLQQLQQHGIKLDALTVLQSDQYQGAAVLLLHGDVYAAAVPKVMAKGWLEANDLVVVSEQATDVSAGIWLQRTRVTDAALEPCLNALSCLTRSGRRDLKMRLFPEWVAGFGRPGASTRQD